MHLRLHIHVTMIVIFCESRSMNSHFDYKLSMRAAEYFYIVLTNWQVTNLKRKKTLKLQTQHISECVF